MGLNELGSIASIIGVVIALIGLTYNLVLKLSRYNEQKRELESEHLDFIISIAEKATTATKRNDSSRWVNHVLSTYRHSVVKARLAVAINLLVGVFCFVVLIHIDFRTVAFYSVGVSIGLAATVAWLAKKYQARVSHLESELLTVWGSKVGTD